MRSSRSLCSASGPPAVRREPRLQRARRRTASAIASILLTAILLPASAPEKRLSVYSIAANYSLPLIQRDGRDYIGLLELLEPLGAVNARSESQRWHIRYNNVE